MDSTWNAHGSHAHWNEMAEGFFDKRLQELEGEEPKPLDGQSWRNRIRAPAHIRRVNTFMWSSSAAFLESLPVKPFWTQILLDSLHCEFLFLFTLPPLTISTFSAFSPGMIIFYQHLRELIISGSSHDDRHPSFPWETNWSCDGFSLINLHIF